MTASRRYFYIGAWLIFRSHSVYVIDGVRSFSKLSSYDFAIKVAIGSILASTILSDSLSLAQGLIAVAALFLIQVTISLIRHKFKPLKSLIYNQASIFMAHVEYFCDNLKEANLTKSNVQEVLRKNGLKSKSEVFVVIMGTTGDMSVIKNDNMASNWSLFDVICDGHLLLHREKKSDETS